MRAPAQGTSSIAMNVVTQGFYVAATSTMPWVLDVAKFHGVAVRVLFIMPHQTLLILRIIAALPKVNRQGGSSVSWKKHGMLYGFQLAMLLGNWTPIATRPESLPSPADPEAAAQVRELVAGLRVTP